MKMPQAKELVRSLQTFIKEFERKHPPERQEPISSLTAEIHVFISSMTETITAHPLWGNADEDEIDNVMESLEKFFMSKLYLR